MVNKLKLEENQEKQEMPETKEITRSKLYDSCIFKAFTEVEVVKKVEPVLECPLSPNEILEDSVMEKALKQNFVKVPESSCKIVAKKKKPKVTENFVKTCMSRNKSSKKMGKTLCPKKKFRYFTPTSLNVNMEEGKKIVYSIGYHSKARTDKVDKKEILLEEFGFESWREGQEESINSIIANQNTLTVLPTGSGKSLIYQMSARLLGGLCVVISPLISLITDQIMRIPPCLSAAALVSGLSYTQYHQIISSAKSGKLDVLFITPERFISESLYQINTIKLICIDEAHCISKYSTSCRFSYMILAKYLKSHLVLALTGSIDKISEADTKDMLNITSVIKHGRAFRKNLHVTVSREDDIITFAGKIVRSEKYRRGSIIFYCNLQYLSDSVAQWLRSKGEFAQSYHAGLGEQKRQQVQEDFNNGKLRILVATVSFGMGIDKSNVVAVIHLHLPYSLEQFIQESGRAGRDGNEAHIHLLVNENTLFFQRSLVYSNHVTKRHILAFGKILHPSLKRKRSSQETSPFIYIQLSSLAQELGVNKETLMEILNYFEQRQLISDISISPLNVEISFHKTRPEELSEKYAIVSHILTTGKKLANCRRIYLPELCGKVMISIKEVVKVIKRLAVTGEIKAEFNDEGFELICLDFPKEIELLSLAKETEEYFEKVEEIMRRKIETCFLVFDKVAEDVFQDCKDVYTELSDLIEEYLQGNFIEELTSQTVPDIEGDVHCIAAQFEGIPDAKDITCILQGINTEKTPYSRWKGYYLWGRYRKFRFLDIYKSVQRDLLEGVQNKVNDIACSQIIEDSEQVN